MCEIEMKGKKINGGIDVDFICSISGKPIRHSNEFGMYCDKFCQLETDKKFKELGESLIKRFISENPQGISSR